MSVYFDGSGIVLVRVQGGGFYVMKLSSCFLLLCHDTETKFAGFLPSLKFCILSQSERTRLFSVNISATNFASLCHCVLPVLPISI